MGQTLVANEEACVGAVTSENTPALGSSVNRDNPPASSTRSNLFGKLASEQGKGFFRRRFER
jgi:hypothetical protein